MPCDLNTITIDSVEFVRADTVAPTPTGNHVLVRSAGAGVFTGILISRTGDEVELANARRIWYWSGAATLSELAVKGTSQPRVCKFPAPVPAITVFGVCEIIPMTEAAVASIAAVPVWSKS